jgi:hypothetical protein
MAVQELARSALSYTKRSQLRVRYESNCPRQGLRLGRRGDAAVDCQVVQKDFDLGRTHFGGMTFAVEQDELTNPVAIRFLGIVAEMAAPADDRNLVEQAGTAGGVVTP